MFTDMREALEAEALELSPLGHDQSDAASRVVARNALDKDDLAALLDALGLPCADDDLVRLLPHLTNPDESPAGEPMTSNAFTATAVSMLDNGDDPEYVRSTLGLSDDELAEAMKLTKPPALTSVPTADTDDSPSIPQATDGNPDAAARASNGPATTGDIDALLLWAEMHPTARIRTRAARVRSDLTELSERYAADAAQREAEKRVAKAAAELEAAQAELRAVKAGGRAKTAAESTTPPASATGPASATAPPARTGKRSKDELAAIRTWARSNGYQVADRGAPAKAVMDAYDAAHHTNSLAEAI